jgi:hypothetical protein
LGIWCLFIDNPDSRFSFPEILHDSRLTIHGQSRPVEGKRNPAANLDSRFSFPEILHDSRLTIHGQSRPVEGKRNPAANLDSRFSFPEILHDSRLTIHGQSRPVEGKRNPAANPDSRFPKPFTITRLTLPKHTSRVHKRSNAAITAAFFYGGKLRRTGLKKNLSFLSNLFANFSSYYQQIIFGTGATYTNGDREKSPDG